jgi:hypothetical protein
LGELADEIGHGSFSLVVGRPDQHGLLALSDEQ